MDASPHEPTSVSEQTPSSPSPDVEYPQGRKRKKNTKYWYWTEESSDEEDEQSEGLGDDSEQSLSSRSRPHKVARYEQGKVPDASISHIDASGISPKSEEDDIISISSEELKGARETDSLSEKQCTKRQRVVPYVSLQQRKPAKNVAKSPPYWLQQLLVKWTNKYSGLKAELQCHPDPAGGTRWGVKCLTCTHKDVMYSAYGRNFGNFVNHVLGQPHRDRVFAATGIMPQGRGREKHPSTAKGKGKRKSAKRKLTQPKKSKAKTQPVLHPNAKPTSSAPKSKPQSAMKAKDAPAPKPTRAAAKNPQHPDADADAAALRALLTSVGLQPALAPALRSVGITDAARMRALGRLPDESLDRLEGSLEDAGLDVAARILVREGLRMYVGGGE